jgi:maltose alpha-D-glucosyltransferase/alpha-amylase
MQLYDRGIRRRLAPMLDGDRRRIELANSLLFTLPGTPVIRYGDEIGMGDDLSLPEREGVRTPMQWSAASHGGFTQSDRPTLPVISGGPFGYEHVNVAAQRRNPDALLNWFERMIRMRKEVPEIGLGRVDLLDPRDPAVLATRYDGDAGSVVFLHNLSEHAREIFFRTGPGAGEGEKLTNLLGNDHSHAGQDGRHRILLEAYGYRWFRLTGADGVMLA